ncbi:hypothetical protein ACFV6E_23185 [Streptomyces sp. NPDC059785]|uniref:hypothetical protein n=1 Tax=unclassified Streptomyces TaxID=2593676 RepID=UPI0036671BB6
MTGSNRRYAHSEATRLLCAGVHLDTVFRARVLDELVGHEERPAPPSLGVDVVSVFTHALRARRQEAAAALVLTGIWAGYFLVEYALARHDTAPAAGSFETGDTGGDVFGTGVLLGVTPVLFYAGVCFLLYSARAANGSGLTMYPASRSDLVRLRLPRRATARGLTLMARAAEIAYVVYAVRRLPDDPFALLFPLAVVFVVGVHRAQLTEVMRRELARDVFPATPAALPSGNARASRIARAVLTEQHAAVALYDAHRPFVGAGKPYEPWSFAMEITAAKKIGDLGSAAGLKNGDGPRRDGADARVQLTNRQIIDLVRPKLEELRTSAARDSRDRLGALEIDEFVYLPSGVSRHGGVYGAESARLHLDGAVDEGGEARRHFLRVRIGAWDEEVVVSVLVRVHTQGRMLVLEVVPHVLGPVTEDYRRADLIAAHRDGDAPREIVRTLLTGPATSVVAGVSGLHIVVQYVRTWLTRPEQAPPDAPLASVRELGSTDSLSLFQEMDVSRYIKTVEDRIASGVREALRSHGCDTGEFEQNIVNVAAGGQFIGQMSGGTAVGRISKSAVAMGSGGASYTEGATG